MGDYMNATFVQRFFAYIIDILIVVILLNLVTFNTNVDKLNDLNSEITNYLAEYDPTNVEEVEKLMDLQYQYEKESVPVNVISLVIIFGYFVCFQFFNKGQTIGKKLLKIRTVASDNKKIAFWQIFVRSLFIHQILVNTISLILIAVCPKNIFIQAYSILTLLQSVFIIITMLFVLYRKDKRGLHDLIVNSYVISERG